ncbi:pyridoxine/pyridoxamine 5'-phosphate oxidase [Qipengyuania flava]|uniref:Pyridoxine/pyridoxamine 5'-phosphate oxidase n=1 Tax=Qipengyuania flava TaxID=192812 RepID=A0A3T1CES4_9SPHN|nr:pyridoxamine 5'-phosphate oxidase [Qipengyuania flava]BBI19466.1 pyridoxine/pyridoxamine 5'-phosphate oxidase [Qipengyuania flava]
MQSDDSAIPASDPFMLFEVWFAEAKEAEPNDANAMALATASEDGFPSVRMVLLKGHGADGFVFYTNAESRKGEQIRANRRAALLFHWKSLRRQIRIEGPLEEVSEAEADTYFHSRPRVSQIGSAASDQSRPLPDRQVYLDRVHALEERYPEGDIPRPAHWTGFRLSPRRIEFWQDRQYRLHDRRLFSRENETEAWSNTLLYP